VLHKFIKEDFKTLGLGNDMQDSETGINVMKEFNLKSLCCSRGSERIVMAKESFIVLWHGGKGRGEKRKASIANLAGHA
jgi:hypothetical protein